MDFAFPFKDTQHLKDTQRRTIMTAVGVFMDEIRRQWKSEGEADFKLLELALDLLGEVIPTTMSAEQRMELATIAAECYAGLARLRSIAARAEAPDDMTGVGLAVLAGAERYDDALGQLLAPSEDRP